LNIRRLKNFPIESPGIFITHTKNLYELLFIFNPDKPSLAIKKHPCQEVL
jgi:hypothetical protein